MGHPELARRLTTGDAVVVGLAAMIGAGIFVAFAPASRSAPGWAVIVALGVAALVALCNAVSSAQLAMAYPSSGGAYLFGRTVLGPWWGFLAGWGFVVGKTASCAAMALAFASYALPGASPAAHRLLAAGAVVGLTLANLRGVTRTAGVAKVLLVATVLTLIGVVAICLGSGVRGPQVWPESGSLAADLRGLLQAAGLLFFALAGYARIATLAEEVRRPEMLGRAILGALGVAVVLYAAVGVALLRVLGSGLDRAAAPVTAAVQTAGAEWAVPIVRLGASAACLGALVALLAGISRTALAMARERDLPRPLASVDAVHRVPDRAPLAIAAGILALVALGDLRAAIGVSSFGVLVYYAVANLAALRQPPEERRWPRAVNGLGLLGCLTLSLTLPVCSVVAGLLVLGVGGVGRAVTHRGR